MKEICIRHKAQVSCIEKIEISKQSLYNLFTNNNGQTIYVTEHSKIVGMITVGNFLRNCLDNRELITPEFIQVRPDHEEDAAKILEKNSWMESVPVINDQNQIEKEYYVRSYLFTPSRIKEIINTIRQIILETKFWENSGQLKKIVLYYDALDNQQLYDLNCKSGENLIIVNKLSIEDIKRYSFEGYRFICDFSPETYRVRSIFYTMYEIDSLKWDLDLNEIKDCLTDRANYFKTNGIAVISDSENYLHKCLNDKEVQLLYPVHLIWNKQMDCLEYTGAINRNIECILTTTFFLDKPYVIFKIENEYKCIPILARLYRERKIGITASEYDIITNIYPTLQKNKVKFMLLKDPDVEYDRIDNKFQKRFIDGRYSQNQRPIFYRAQEDGSKKRIQEISSFVPRIKDGILQRIDTQGKYVNCINGERYTIENTGTGPYIFHVFGPCTLIGTAVEDKCTIPSRLRPIVPKSYYIKNHVPSYENINYAIRAEEFGNKDIVMFMVSNIDLFEKSGIKTYSIIQAYKDMPNLLDNIFDELKHANQIALEYIAKEIADICISEHIFESIEDKSSIKEKKITFGTGRTNLPKELKEWLTNSSKKYKINHSGKVGAVVMNCNPFTRGHRYLIEQASSCVDILYVFILEEDKSYFNFQSRFDMVKAGTKDLNNVIVLPSGKYVISTQTMPGYFNKEEQPFVEADAALDLSFFAGAIAKEFNIKIRFAGEEPKDKFTKKYNEAMSRILPKYGIEFCEIPRKQLGDLVISASLVRKYLAEHKYEAIKELVLPCTYEYLMHNWLDSKSIVANLQK